MALSITTDLTVLTTAEVDTGWVDIGAQSALLEPDFCVQGSNCLSRAVSGASVEKGMVYDNGSGIDFTSGSHKDKLVYIWMRVNTPQLVDTRAAGGMKVRLVTTDMTAYREWYVDGSDTSPATEGWICYVVDPQSAGSSTTGSYNANSVRYFGGTIKTTTTAKGQNLGIDQISYGRGELYVAGVTTTTGSGFKEAAAVAYDTAKTNRWGIITEKAGVYYVRGKIIIGHGITNSSANWTVAVSGNVVTVQTIVPHNMANGSTVQTNASWTNNAFMASLSKTITSTPTATSFTFTLTQADQGATTETNASARLGAYTVFSSRGETVVWETPAYKDASAVVKSIPDASVGGTTGKDGKTTYNGIAFMGGGGSSATDIGVIVGTAAGRSGSSLTCAKNDNLGTPGRTLATVTADDDTTALALYATTFKGFEGQIDLTGTGIDDDDCFGCTFDTCGRVDSNMEIRNCNFLNSVATSTDGTLIWNSTTNLQSCVFANNSRATVFEATTGTPFTFTGITFAGNSYDVRNESLGAITINVYTGTTPTVEDSGVGSSTTIVAGVLTEITVKDIITDAAISDAEVWVPVATGGPLRYQDSVQSLTRTVTTATVSMTQGNTYVLSGDKMLIKGATQQEYNGVFVITVSNPSTFTYQLPDTGAGALTINVNAAARTFTRTTGNYVTDGFRAGANITTSGFVSPGNNAAKVIESVTTTVITVTNGTFLADESGNNNERIQTTPVTPATGTIVATSVLIHGPTNGSGVASLTRIIPTAQPITGRVRKSSGSPYYKTSTFTGTVNATTGFSTTVQMVRDD